MDQEPYPAKNLKIRVYVGQEKNFVPCPEKQTGGLSGIQVVFFEQGVEVGTGQA